MAARPPSDVRRRRDDLVRGATAAGSVTELFAEAARRLRSLVPHDAAAWLATDPAAGFPTAPSRVEGVTASADLCELVATLYAGHYEKQHLGDVTRTPAR
jgi:hypothetical protein